MTDTEAAFKERFQADEEELDRLDNEMRARWSEVGAQMITARDIARCPKQVWTPKHYREDGSCRCNERDEAMAVLKEATALKRRVDALHSSARSWLTAT
jgi:leucyl aminopeptidase